MTYISSDLPAMAPQSSSIYFSASHGIKPLITHHLSLITLPMPS